MKANAELRSKMMDGILPGMLLFLLFVVVILMVSPIEFVAGKPGVMIYALGLLAIAVICLERAVNLQISDVSRALNGVAGGALIWSVVEVSNYLGSFVVESVTGGLIFITVVCIAATVWQRGLPMGIQYFAGTFILFWGGYLVIASDRIVNAWLAEAETVLSGIGWVFLVLASIAASLILFKSRNRLERIWGAVLLAFFMILALNTFQRPGL